MFIPGLGRNTQTEVHLFMTGNLAYRTLHAEDIVAIGQISKPSLLCSFTPSYQYDDNRNDANQG